MFSFFKKNNSLSTTEAVDLIEEYVGPYLKDNGFKKHGRTYCRFVEEDIAQVVNFQNGCAAKGVTGILWVNLGIRVPESFERSFINLPERAKYYKEYECNIRCRLGELAGEKHDSFDLNKGPEKIAKDILNSLKKYAMPLFELYNSRESILRNRRKKLGIVFAEDTSMIILEEAMIYGRMGNLEKADELFNLYYDIVVEDRRRERKIDGKIINGCKVYYTPNNSHIDYLEEKAEELGIKITNRWDRKESEENQ